VNQETEEEAVLLSMVTYLCDDNAIDPDQERGLVIPHGRVEEKTTQALHTICGSYCIEENLYFIEEIRTFQGPKVPDSDR
jgi:hypothetical protein